MAALISISLSDSKVYNISVTPQSTGPHLLQLEADQQPIKNSPYKINVKSGNIDEIEKIKIYGPAFHNNLIGIYNCML